MAFELNFWSVKILQNNNKAWTTSPAITEWTRRKKISLPITSRKMLISGPNNSAVTKMANRVSSPISQEPPSQVPPHPYRLRPHLSYCGQNSHRGCYPLDPLRGQPDGLRSSHNNLHLCPDTKLVRQRPPAQGQEPIPPQQLRHNIL